MCFKCLVSTEKLLYIDKSYKNEMDEFERIKELTAEAVRSNQKNASIIKQWKLEIRKKLMKVRETFIQDIDKFIYQFGAVFKNVENSPNLYEFRGEDKRL